MEAIVKVDKQGRMVFPKDVRKAVEVEGEDKYLDSEYALRKIGIRGVG